MQSSSSLLTIAAKVRMKWLCFGDRLSKGDRTDGYTPDAGSRLPRPALPALPNEKEHAQNEQDIIKQGIEDIGHNEGIGQLPEWMHGEPHHAEPHAVAEEQSAIFRARFFNDEQAQRDAEQCEDQLIELRRMDGAGNGSHALRPGLEDHTPREIGLAAGAAAVQKAAHAGDRERGGAGDRRCVLLQQLAAFRLGKFCIEGIRS